MKTKSISRISIILFFLPTLIFAQESTSTKKTHFDIEADPLGYLLKGYSLHLGLNKGIGRLNVGFVGFEYPNDYNGNEGITARTNGVSLKWDYVNPKLKGFYFGPQSDLSQLRLKVIDDKSQSETLNQATLGLRIGYRLMFGSKKGDMKYIFNKKEPVEKGFYLNLWATYIFNLTAKDVTLLNLQYNIPNQTFFPTVHLGWKF